MESVLVQNWTVLLKRVSCLPPLSVPLIAMSGNRFPEPPEKPHCHAPACTRKYRSSETILQHRQQGEHLYLCSYTGIHSSDRPNNILDPLSQSEKGSRSKNTTQSLYIQGGKLGISVCLTKVHFFFVLVKNLRSDISRASRC